LSSDSLDIRQNTSAKRKLKSFKVSDF
jgi:hypothetical protein